MRWRVQQLLQFSTRCLNRSLQRPVGLSPNPAACFSICASTSRRRQSQYAENKSALHAQPRVPSLARASSTDGNVHKLYRHADLLSQKGSENETFKTEIKVAGLVQSIRKQKKAAFAHLSDGSTLEPLQAVLSPEQATHITNGTFVKLGGLWRKSLGKGQDYELEVRNVEDVGPSDPEKNPIQKKYQTPDYLRSIPHLRLRVPFHSLVARARSTLTSVLITQLVKEHNHMVHPPLITSSDCEGAGEVFTITPHSASPRVVVDKAPQHYFREPKYLTVSSQLHLEAYSAELGNVFALSPTFRAEESDTPRHLSEFYMLEGEFRPMGTLEELMSAVEETIAQTIISFRDSNAGQELLRYYSDEKHHAAEDHIDLSSRWERLLTRGYTRIPHHTAVEHLLKADASTNGSLFKTKPSYSNGLQLEHERWIVEHMGNGRPTFVTHYPKSAKPFYMLPSDAQSSLHPSSSGVADPASTVACFDLLIPHGYCEVAGGSLREHRLENLIATMRERGMLKKRSVNVSIGDNSNSQPTKDSDYPFLHPDEDLGSLRWYADLRRFGSSRHGGYGLGFDRLLAYLVGVGNVRDVVAFPRTWGRADC